MYTNFSTQIHAYTLLINEGQVQRIATNLHTHLEADAVSNLKCYKTPHLQVNHFNLQS